MVLFRVELRDHEDVGRTELAAEDDMVDHDVGLKGFPEQPKGRHDELRQASTCSFHSKSLSLCKV